MKYILEYDITEYPISTGGRNKMVYADNILHNIQIMSNDTNKTVVAFNPARKPFLK